MKPEPQPVPGTDDLVYWRMYRPPGDSLYRGRQPMVNALVIPCGADQSPALTSETLAHARKWMWDQSVYPLPICFEIERRPNSGDYQVEWMGGLSPDECLSMIREIQERGL